MARCRETGRLVPGKPARLVPRETGSPVPGEPNGWGKRWLGRVVAQWVANRSRVPGLAGETKRLMPAWPGETGQWNQRPGAGPDETIPTGGKRSPGWAGESGHAAPGRTGCPVFVVR